MQSYLFKFDIDRVWTRPSIALTVRQEIVRTEGGWGLPEGFALGRDVPSIPRRWIWSEESESDFREIEQKIKRMTQVDVPS